MAYLTQAEKNLLGPIIEPFERSNKSPDRKVIKDGEREKEEFLDFIHDAYQDDKPPKYVVLNTEEIEIMISNGGRYREKCFLWVIDETSIKIIREKTRNVKRTHDPECVCHTNLTGAGKAYVGGELFFGEDGNVYLNPFSDRYGKPSPNQWLTAKKYIISVGYNKIIDILDLI
jgi:hypothetical protein